jgi:GNAT superfamily N-acetyltransferase
MTTVRTVDPHDDAAFHAWYDAYTVGFEAGRIDPGGWTYAEAAAVYRQPSASFTMTAFAAYDEAEQCVGGAWGGLPQKENLQRLELNICVPPEHRRQGVGTALLTSLIEFARQNGRNNLLGGIHIPVGETDWPGVAFFTRHGFTFGITEVRRQQPLPVPAERLDALAAKAKERSADYAIVSWEGRCPDEYAEQYARLKALLDTEAPSGEIEFEVADWDVSRLRDDEDAVERQGRTMFATIAVAKDGTVAAHTQAVVSKHDPSRASQWDTLVLPAYRGHRLGLAVKVANLRALQAAHPETTRMDTWNAEENGPMVAVNEELGYRIMEYNQGWQRTLDHGVGTP